MLNLTPLILLLPAVGFVLLGLTGRWLPRAAIALVGCGVVLVAFGLALANFISMQTSPAPHQSDVVVWSWVASGTLHIDFGLLYDPLSAVMLLVVTGVGFLIHVYSIGYMEGDTGFWRFFSFLNLFVFAMTLLVAADNFLFLLIGWAGVGLSSFLLIGFWYTRPSAVAAARKAFVVNVIGDFGLLIAIFLLFARFNTLAYNGLLFVLGTSGPGLVAAYPINGQQVIAVGLLLFVAAARKAFVVNVIGDFGLLIAIFLLFARFNTLAYNGLLFVLGTSGPGLVAAYPINGQQVIAVGLLLFVAAAAKSAQFPLHVWLPDAMEGPTPVSALIHAATMVTAGVYLVARCAPLYDRTPTVLAVIAGIGGFTAIFAASIACVQYDIKRILAYSTISQLGYMFMAEGAGGYSAGIFHLTTHAYFKALLFMAAGGVIHALAGEQDMRRMGGLRAKLPITWWTFVFGGLALAAIVPFSGFWSKDGVLSAVWQRALSGDGTVGWYILYAVGLVTAGLTGFYIFRLIFTVFLGGYRGEPLAAHAGPAGHGQRERTDRSGRRDPLAAAHEVGWTMSVPMVVLAALSLIGGFEGTPWNDTIGALLEPVTGASVGLQVGSVTFFISMALSLICALVGIYIAWVFYGARQHSFKPSGNFVHRLLSHRYYVDDFYDWVIVRPIVWFGQVTTGGLEHISLDGGGRGVGWLTARLSGGLRRLQTGYVRNYALGILLGAAAILIYYVVRF